MTVFTQKMGQSVGKDFYVQAGMPVGGMATVPVTVPGAMGGKVPTPVDFSTGCVAVEFNLKREYQKRGTTMTTASMLYLDEKGRLRIRIQAEDAESPVYKGTAAAAPPAPAGG